MKKTILTIYLLMLFGIAGFANVTNPFSVAMLEADKVILVKVEKADKESISVGLLKTFKGKPVSKELEFKVCRQLKGVAAGDICFILLNKDHSVYVSPFGCGSYSVIVIRKGKVHRGIFKYQHKTDNTLDYSHNSEDFNSFGQVQNGIVSGLKQEKKQDKIIPQDLKGNFVLYVSNQSFAESPVDITISINGKQAVSGNFDVGNQHNWKKHQFQLAPGKYRLVAESKKGKARFEKEFEIKNAKLWAAMDYWYYPKKDGKKFFTILMQHKPIYFE